MIERRHEGAFWGEGNSLHLELDGAVIYQALHLDFPGGTNGKEPARQCRRHKRCKFNSWVGEIPWRRAWQPTPVFLPREFHGERSLAGYSPWGHKESDTTEHTHTHKELLTE